MTICENSPTIEQIEDFVDNMAYIDLFIESDNETETTPDGTDRLTLEGIALAFTLEEPVDYEAGILIERRTQVINYNGLEYRYTGELPYTLTGDPNDDGLNPFDETRWAWISGDPVVNPEKQTLSSGQTTITLLKITNAVRAVFYINGVNADNGRLVPNTDYTIPTPGSIELKGSYPEGTTITGFEFDVAPAGQVLTFAGRTDDVDPEAGDYDASQIDNDSQIFTGTYVSDALDTIGTTVIKADTDVLVAGQDNEIQVDSTTTSFPLANSVPANTKLSIIVADKNAGITSTHDASGFDNITDATGSDTQLVITWNTGGVVTLISNGVDEWRI